MKLKPYQKKLIASMRTGMLNQSMAGSGKTAVALHVLAKQGGKHCIVCPNPVKQQWLDEAARWGLTLDLTVYGYEEIRIKLKRGDDFPNFDTCTLDEVHRAKNPRGLTHRALMAFLWDGTIKFRQACSATPVTRSPEDVFGIFRLLLGDKFFGNYFSFMYTYCETSRQYRTLPSGKRSFFTKIVGSKNMELLAKKIAAHWVAAPEEEILKSMPEILETDPQVVTLSGNERSLYRGIRDGYLSELRKLTVENPFTAMEGGVKMMRLQQLLSCASSISDIVEKSKIQAVADYVEDLAPEKVVVFTRFVPAAEALCTAIPHSVLYSGSNIHEREKNKAQFITDESTRVFIATDAGGTGLDGLQGVAHYLVHLDLPWNWSDYRQRIGRLHRTGSRSDYVISTTFIVRGTIDQFVQKKINLKKELHGALFTNQEEIEEALTLPF